MISTYVSITGIYFSIAAIIIMGIYKNNNSFVQLQQLGHSVTQIQQQTNMITSNIASTNANLPILIQKNVTFNQCITNGNNLCSNLTTRYENDLSNINNVYTVSSLNNSYITKTTDCDNNINILKMMILMFNTGTANLPVLIQTGNVNVNIGTDNVLALYEVYNLKLAQMELDIFYLVISPWSLSITSNLVNPMVRYQTFTPAISSCTNVGISLGRHKVVQVQSSLFSPSFVSGYGYEMFCNGDIHFKTQGVLGIGNTAQLLQKLMILIN
jgi:hypothetical protein